MRRCKPARKDDWERQCEENEAGLNCAVAFTGARGDLFATRASISAEQLPNACVCVRYAIVTTVPKALKCRSPAARISDPKEVERLIVATKKRTRRYSLRDATMILVAFRHGLRVSELCMLTWDQIDFLQGMMHVRRMKGGIPSVQQIGGEEMRMLRALKREDGAARYMFMTERRAPMTTAGFRKLLSRLAVGATFPFPVHPHMLRHATGYKRQ